MQMEVEKLKSNSELSSIELESIESNSVENIKKAYELYDACKYEDSLSIAERNSQISSTSSGQVLIGNCYYKLNNKEKALLCWKKAVSISPLEYSAYLNIGNELYRQKNINEAIFNWHLANSVMPENASVNLNLANAYNKKENRILATKYFEKYLKYEKNIHSSEYEQIKQVFSNLTAKVDFYAKKVEEYKIQKDIKTIAALYFKMISTYANLPAIYTNIAEIFMFDKNYEKALEFYKKVYLNFSYTPQIVLEIANIYYLLNKSSYAYVYYKRAFDLVPEGTSFSNKIKSNLSSLSFVLSEPDTFNEHLEIAQNAEKNNEYEIAIDEYENYLILSESEFPDIQQKIDKYKIFLNPEPFVVNVLYSQISELMRQKKLNTCIDVCDRIITLGNSHSKEVIYAMRCKTECRRIIIAREQFGV